MDLEELVVKIKGDISDFKDKMNDVKNTTNSVGDLIQKNSTKFLVAGGAITGVLGVFVKNAAEAEVANSQLANALRVAGEYSEATMNKMLNLATQIQNYSGLSDEALQSAMRFGLQLGLNGDQVTQLLPKLVDFSIATGVDLNTAMKLATVTMEGNTGALKRYGIEVQKSEDGTVSFNNVLDAFTGFAGSAETQGNTLTGQLNIMKQQFGDLTEKLGAVLIPILKDLIQKYLMPLIEKFAELDPKVVENGVKFTAFAGTILLVGGTVSKLISLFSGLGALFTPQGLILVGIGAFIVLLVKIIENWDKIKAGFTNFYERYIKPWLDPTIAGLKAIIGFFEKIAGFVKSTWNKVKEALSSGTNNKELNEALSNFAGGFAEGGSFVVSKPTMFLAGERGTEYVSVTPQGKDENTPLFKEMLKELRKFNEITAPALSRQISLSVSGLGGKV